MRSYWCAIALLSSAVFPQDGRELTYRYATEINQQLRLPIEEQQFYGAELARLFAGSGPQFIGLVDRSPNVQAFLLYWRGADGVMHWIGASPVSTGHPGRFDYFETPLGVFDHTVENPDYRAEGTRNEYGICGYGVKGMRVYDFGWVRQNKGWGDRAEIEMRFQMHATDPDFLEPKLGTAQSKGCIRIPGSLNKFLDNYGVLDDDYVRAFDEGHRPFVLGSNWRPIAGAGRYLVVIDSDRAERPAWAITTPRPAPPPSPRAKPAYPPTIRGALSRAGSPAQGSHESAHAHVPVVDARFLWRHSPGTDVSLPRPSRWHGGGIGVGRQQGCAGCGLFRVAAEVDSDRAGRQPESGTGEVAG